MIRQKIVPNGGRKNPLVFDVGGWVGRQPLALFIFRSLNRREAHVVFLNNRRIQRIEIQQKNEFVIQAFLGLQDETSFVGWFSLPFASFSFNFLGSIRQHIVQSIELVEQQILNTFSSGSDQRAIPAKANQKGKQTKAKGTSSDRTKCFLPIRSIVW